MGRTFCHYIQNGHGLVEPVGNSVTHPTAETWQNLVTKAEKSLWSLCCSTFNLGMSISDKTAAAASMLLPVIVCQQQTVASVFCHNQTLLVAPCLFRLTRMLIGPVISRQALNKSDGRFSKWKL